jgi:hypothetical protein
MESIVQVVKGNQIDDPSKYVCCFCTDPAVSLFGVTTIKKFNGVILKTFGVCQIHLDKINSMLSGEFDIDQIFLERYKAKAGKTLKVRGHPSITLAKTQNIKTLKECAFPGCSNKFYGIVNRKYCADPRCKELRKSATIVKTRTKQVDPDADNLILPKRISKKIKRGKVLVLTCRARDGDSCRCKNKFTVIFEPQKLVYPKYCEEHRTAHRRQRFLLRKSKNA